MCVGRSTFSGKQKKRSTQFEVIHWVQSWIAKKRTRLDWISVKPLADKELIKMCVCSNSKTSKSAHWWEKQTCGCLHATMMRTPERGGGIFTEMWGKAQTTPSAAKAPGWMHRPQPPFDSGFERWQWPERWNLRERDKWLSRCWMFGCEFMTLAGNDISNAKTSLYQSANEADRNLQRLPTDTLLQHNNKNAKIKPSENGNEWLMKKVCVGYRLLLEFT